MRKTVLKCTAIILLATLATACTSWKNKKITEVFNPLITSYTGGEIGAKEKITITLSKELNINSIDSSSINDIVEIYPSQECSVTIENSSTISLKPKTSWEKGQSYRVRVNLEKIFHKEEPEFLFDLFVKRQAYFIKLGEFQAISSTDPSTYNLYGTLHLVQPEDLSLLQSGLMASQEGENLKIIISNSTIENTYNFVIQGVVRKNQNSTISVNFEGNLIGAKNNTNVSFSVPRLNEFTILDIVSPGVSGVPYKIIFSDVISSTQNLEGLFTIEGVDVQVSVDKNIVSITPVQELQNQTDLFINGTLFNYKGDQYENSNHVVLSPHGKTPSVEFIGRGTIFPSDGKIVLPIKTTNLRAVTVRVIEIFENNVANLLQENNLNRVSSIKRYGNIVAKRNIVLDDFAAEKSDHEFIYGLDLTNFVKRKPGALFMVSVGFKREFVALKCIDFDKNAFYKLIADSTINETEKGYFSSDYFYDEFTPDSEYDYDEYDYDEYSNPCSASYYMRDHSESKIIMMSDIGVIANVLDDNKLNVITSSISSTKPIGNVIVKAFSLQHQVIGEGKTNGDGIANFDCKQLPFYLVAYNNEERGYLKLDDNNRQQTGAFETDGVTNSEHLKGYMYGERGVWRPGDTCFVSFVLQDIDNKLPAGHPISIQLLDNQGRVIGKELFAKGDGSIYSSHFVIPESGATGTWRAEATVGNSTFSLPIKVETIKPNRLRIGLNIENKILKTKDNSPVTLKGNWLSGLISPNLKFEASYTLSEIENPFPALKGYSFTNPFTKFENRENILVANNLDNKGEYSFSPQFLVEPQLGMVNAKVKVRLFEAGGDFSTDFFNTKISPCDTYCGILDVNKSNYQAISNNELPLKIITVDENGNRKSVNNLSFSIYRVDYSFWWQQSGKSKSDFITSSSQNLLKQGFVTTSNGEGIIKFNAPNERYWATYFVLIDNSTNGNIVGTTFSLQNGQLVEDYREDKKVTDNKLINFSAKKSKYQVGETASVIFPSSDDGKAVITIFKNGKIIQQEVTSTDGNQTEYEFKVTEDMVPNIYLSINTLQSYKNTENDMPVRMYGLANIYVEDPNSKLEPQITAPSEIKPNSEVTIQIKEKNGQECDYTLAIVDEGLLDLTHFKTPQPFNYFFQKEGYTINSFDIYNYVLGGYFGGFDEVFGIGGDDGSLGAGKNQKATRFKPMVKFVGPFRLKKNGKATQTISIPYYVGSVRVMVIAASPKSYGSAETTMKVKNSFMVVSSLPRVLSPNDEIEIPVTLLSDAQKTQEIDLSVATSEHFTALESTSKKVSLAEGEEKTIVFKYKIGSQLGAAKFCVTAICGDDKIVENVDIEVRNPNNPATLSKPFTLKPNEEISFDVKNGDWSNFKAKLELSKAKSLNLNHRLNYLITYPHGCVEQTTSAAFPQLYLSTLLNLTPQRKIQIEQNVKYAIAKLALFQKGDGGLSYWPTGTISDDWGSSYAGNFLLEAQKFGYNVPASLIKNWIAYQSKEARSWSVDNMKSDHGYVQNTSDNQAYRLYTLALAQQPDLAAMNRLRSYPECSTFAQWLLASSYAMIGQVEVANNFVDKIKNKPVNGSWWDYNYGSEERDKSLMLSTLVTLNRMDDALEISNYLASRLNSTDYLNTQATAMSLISMANFYAASNLAKDIKASVSLASGNQEINSINSIESIDIKGNNVKVKNNGSGTLFGNYLETGIPINPITESYWRNMELQVSYLDKDNSPINFDNIAQGTDITIKVVVKNSGTTDNYKNLALTQILPTGWEIRNLRLEGNEGLVAQNFTYQDIRDDRVYTYFNLNHAETKTFTLFATANYKGQFYLPSVLCESMYSNNIAAQVAGNKIVVK